MAHGKPARHVAVAIIFSVDTRRILMITSRKHPHLWILPKGGVENGETSAQAAVRESWEEAGTPRDLPAPDDGDGLMTLSLEAAPHQKRASVWHVHVVHVPEASVHAVHDWPERGERQREWVSLETGLERIQAWYTDQTALGDVDGEALDEGGDEAALESDGKRARAQGKKEKKGGAMESALRRFIESLHSPYSSLHSST